MATPNPAIARTQRSTLGRLLGGFAAVATVLSMSVLIPSQAAHAVGTDPIYVPDANFRECLIDALGFADGDEITEDDAASLTGSLNCTGSSWQAISDITGANFLTELTQLQLGSNEIENVTPLKDLTELNELTLNSNNISDITPLQDLVTLTTLRLDDNSIDDIDALTDMTQMFILSLSNNMISDVTPLIGMDDANSIYLSGNRITDVSPLNGHLPNISTGNSLDLTDQTLDLGELEIGVPTPVPVVTDVDGTAIDFYTGVPNNEDGTFTPTSAGDPLAWWKNIKPIPSSPRSPAFSGSFTYTPVPAVIEPVAIDAPLDGAVFVEGSSSAPVPTSVTGSAEPGTDVDVTVFESGTAITGPTTVTADVATGAWEFVFAPALVPGTYTVQASQGSDTAQVSFVVEAAAVPTEPVIGSIDPGAEFTTCDAPTGVTGTGEPGATLFVALWDYPDGHGTGAVLIEEIETEVSDDGMWSVAFTDPLEGSSYSVAADQRVSGDTAGYTEHVFTVAAANCDTTGAGDAGGGDTGSNDTGSDSTGDAVQSQNVLASTGSDPNGGVYAAGVSLLLLAAGSALLVARRKRATAR